MNPAYLTPRRVQLVRHGEVETAYHRVFGGRIDMELSPTGHEHAGAIATYLHRRGVGTLVCSPMRRAASTARPIAESLGLEPIVEPGLREVDFGLWTGLGWDQVRERFGRSAFDWVDELERGGIPEAESIPAFRARTEAALLLGLERDQTGTLTVVCHGGVIRMLLSALLGMPVTHTTRLDVEYGSLTAVRLGPKGPEIELLNFTPWRDLA